MELAAGIILAPMFEILLHKLVSLAKSKYYARREERDGELKNLEEMEGELKKLEIMLRDIRAVLADAEDKQMTNDSVKLWMDDLTDVAYDLDDLLDELVTDTWRSELIMEESQASSQIMAESQARSLIMAEFQASTSTTSKVRKLIPTCFACFTPPPPPSAHATVKFDHPPPSAHAVKLDHDMMSKVEEINARLKDIENRKNSLKLKESAEGIGSKTRREGWETTSVVYKSEVYGRVQDQEAIVKELLRDEVSVHKFSVIPIVGMGGIGKTTLAQLVYNDERLEGHFDPKVWVCVSDDFHAYVHRVTKAILDEVTRQTHDSTMSLNMLQQKLKENLFGKKFLLVLDDVWNNKYEDWELLKRPFMLGASGSKIIVTTRNKTIASTMTLQSLTYSLKELPKDECLSLFAHHALERENFDAHPDLKGIGEEIVNKCKGLPLAVKTLAGLLRTERRQSGWMDILNSKIWDLPEESNILPALRLSYHHLPSHLKQCFAYCATFPKDHEFDKDELVLLWMAVGLLQLSKEKNRMEYFGYKYFDDLLSRSFFQQSAGSKSRFVMHDLLNDLAQHVAGEICFRVDKLEGNEQFEIPKRARHLSFFRQRLEVIQKFRPISKVKHLRTLLPLQFELGFHYLSKKVLFDLLPNLLCLRVLSLSSYSITELPDSIGNLKHLRYLNLSDTFISQLPESVSTLYNLQTLLLHSCNNLCMLPSNIGNLINLRHLDITDTSRLREMCLGIGRLTNLQTLSKFVVGQENGAKLKELGNLSLLRGSISILELQNITDVRDANEAKFRAKECLNEVELTWRSVFNVSRNEDLELNVLDKLQPHRNLERLKVEFYWGTKFPSWVGDPSFSEMVNLSLVDCRKCRYLPPLGQLPKLKELCIKGMPEVQNLRDEFYGDSCSLRVPFPSLETLIFENMAAWGEWTSSISSGVEESGKAFPCLRELAIRCCPKLIKVSLLRLPSLHKLQVQECQEVVLKSIIDVTSLTSLEVENITGLSQLEEPLVQSLVAVESIVIKECNQLVSLWENGVACMNLLQKLEIRDCVNLEKLPNEITCLTSLEINGCSKLVCFPQMKTGVQHTLRRLEIRNCNALESLPEGISSLEHLEIHDCRSLESLPKGISGLEYLEIRHCPSFVCFSKTKTGVPHRLRRLAIWNCNALESLPEGIFGVEDLEIDDCPSLRSWPTKNMLPTTLKVLAIHSCENLELVSETMRMAQQEEELREFNNINIMMSSVEELRICKWPNIGKLLGCVNNFASLRVLGIRNCESVESLSFPERERGLLPNLRDLYVSECVNLRSLLTTNHIIQNLESIEIQDCPGLESFGLFTPNLRRLWIWRCAKLNSLPFDQIQSLASLESIRINDCPCLESFPQANFHFPPNLIELRTYCWGKELMKPLSEWGLHRLTSLRSFRIAGGYPELVSFPPPSPSEEYCLLPTTLTSLWIKDLPNLKSISSKGGFHNLTSLQHLSIHDCPKLGSLPKEGLPATLQRLFIRGCPVVEKRCSEENKGDYWPHIAHIPCVDLAINWK